jgi:outer membrane protein TolC
MDYPSTRVLPITAPTSPARVEADVERLIALSAEHNPELARLSRQAERDRQRIKLAELAVWPDFHLGVEWTYVEPRDPFIPPVNPQTGQQPPINAKSDEGDDNWALSVQFNVPIWFERIAAAKREARRRLEQTLHERQAASDMIAYRIHDAWLRAMTHQDTIRLVASTLIPQARQAYEVSLTAYQAGQTEFLTVIDNWQLWLDFELMRHREIAELESAVSELQREVGLQLIRADLLLEGDTPEEQP